MVAQSSKYSTAVDILYYVVVKYHHNLHKLIVNIATIGTVFEIKDYGY